MTVIRLLDLWNEAVDCRDGAYDYEDYRLGNYMDSYLDMLAEEILAFERQL